MSDFKWTDERVKEFARVYCGNPTEGYNAEAFHGLKMDEKIDKFKQDVLMKQMRKDVILSTSTQDLRDELRQRGYAVGSGCLWMSKDVRPHDPSHSLTEDEHMEIMEEVLTSDWLMEQISSMIQDEVWNYKDSKK